MSDTPYLPMTKIHSAESCVEGQSVQVEGYKVELLHGQNLAVGFPVLVALCECCEPMTDAEMKRLSDAALEQLAPMHFLRQTAVASGAELWTELEACAALKIKHTKFWDLIRDGVLPQPMKREGRNVWLRNEVLQSYARGALKEKPEGDSPLNRHQRRKAAAKSR